MDPTDRARSCSQHWKEPISLPPCCCTLQSSRPPSVPGRYAVHQRVLQVHPSPPARRPSPAAGAPRAHAAAWVGGGVWALGLLAASSSRQPWPAAAHPRIPLVVSENRGFRGRAAAALPRVPALGFFGKAGSGGLWCLALGFSGAGIGNKTSCDDVRWSGSVCVPPRHCYRQRTSGTRRD